MFVKLCCTKILTVQLFQLNFKTFSQNAVFTNLFALLHRQTEVHLTKKKAFFHLLMGCINRNC